MKKFCLIAALSISAASATAASPACSSIKGSAARLACYDKAAAAAPVAMDVMPPPFPTSAAAPVKPVDGEVFKSGLWSVMQAKDSMTDKNTCTSIYKHEWNFQGSGDTLFLSLKGRGGVDAITLRLDDSPPGSMRLASDLEKRISAAKFQTEFQQIYQSKRMRVQVLTILHSVVNEDIDLTGFKEATDYIRANCSV